MISLQVDNQEYAYLKALALFSWHLPGLPSALRRQIDRLQEKAFQELRNYESEHNAGDSDRSSKLLLRLLPLRFLQVWSCRPFSFYPPPPRLQLVISGVLTNRLSLFPAAHNGRVVLCRANRQRSNRQRHSIHSPNGSRRVPRQPVKREYSRGRRGFFRPAARP